MSDEPVRWWRYAVIRGDDLPPGLDGRWYDLDEHPEELRQINQFFWDYNIDLKATDRWEQRDDGAVAVVYRRVAT